jgi:hypothetical protein
LKTKIFSLPWKNALAYFNAAVVDINSIATGLPPKANPTPFEFTATTAALQIGQSIFTSEKNNFYS